MILEFLILSYTRTPEYNHLFYVIFGYHVLVIQIHLCICTLFMLGMLRILDYVQFLNYEFDVDRNPEVLDFY